MTELYYLPLENAKKMVGKSLTVWGDKLHGYDVENIDNLRDFIAMFLAVDGQAFVKGNGVSYVPNH